jgi:hypothetical protein
MIFILRMGSEQHGRRPDDPGIRIVLERRTPEIASGGERLTDLFCIGSEDASERLAGDGWRVVTLRDGWYADDSGGGVAVWGQGAFWEVRDTPFTVKEAVGPAPAAADGDGGEGGETLDVRRGIFGV